MFLSLSTLRQSISLLITANLCDEEKIVDTYILNSQIIPLNIRFFYFYITYNLL